MEETKSQDNGLTIVVLGASGDLSKKKTFPALYDLYSRGMFPEHLRIVGYARSKKSDEDFKTFLKSFLPAKESQVDEFLSVVSYFQGQYNSAQDMASLSLQLNELESKAGVRHNRIFYFALPPSVFTDAARAITEGKARTNEGWNRFVLEKPFGRDLESSEKLVKSIGQYLTEEEVYRIDHYLGKEMVMNLLIMRFANAAFEPMWNRNHVQIVQVIMKEPFGTEGRGGYFDDIGIIRDVMQNHLMQIVSLIAMESPVSLSPEDIRDEKVKVLRCITPPTLKDAVIGQYGPSPDGHKPGYLDDDTVPKDSKCATYAALVFYINNPRWHGVPFVLKCGKALNERKAEIRIQFKTPPHNLFSSTAIHNNELVMRVQPHEAIYLKMMAKSPDLGGSPMQTELDLSYKRRFPTKTPPDAYARLIHDVTRGEHSNFVRADELSAAWRVFTPLLHEMEEKDFEPIIYPYGSRGPAEADELSSRSGYRYSAGYATSWQRAVGQGGSIDALEKMKREYELPLHVLTTVLDTFMREMENGLQGDQTSTLKMIPAFVDRVPSGKEQGTVWAIDMGGSNMRVVSVTLKGDREVGQVKDLHCRIPDTAMKGTGAELFGFVAEKMKASGVKNGDRVGFTFSFPVQQQGVNRGKLIEWTKGFTASGVQGEEVVGLLEKSLEKEGLGEVKVVALVNDTVGTLVARAYRDPSTLIGLIIGTGTNAAYVERLSNIPKWDSPNREGVMVVNMEWGGFGSNGESRRSLPLTDADLRVNRNSPNPDRQQFEKMISGMYLGEISRECLNSLEREGLLWSADVQVPAESNLRKPWSFDTSYVSEISMDSSPHLDKVGEVLNTVFGLKGTTYDDRKIVQEVCNLVVRRSARLAAMGIAAITLRMTSEGLCSRGISAGVDGSVFLRHPFYQEWMEEALKELGVNTRLYVSTDGSGLGAAIIAAMMDGTGTDSIGTSGGGGSSGGEQ